MKWRLNYKIYVNKHIFISLDVWRHPYQLILVIRKITAGTVILFFRWWNSIALVGYFSVDYYFLAAVIYFLVKLASGDYLWALHNDKSCYVLSFYRKLWGRQISMITGTTRSAPVRYTGAETTVENWLSVHTAVNQITQLNTDLNSRIHQNSHLASCPVGLSSYTAQWMFITAG